MSALRSRTTERILSCALRPFLTAVCPVNPSTAVSIVEGSFCAGGFNRLTAGGFVAAATLADGADTTALASGFGADSCFEHAHNRVAASDTQKKFHLIHSTDRQEPRAPRQTTARRFHIPTSAVNL